MPANVRYRADRESYDVKIEHLGERSSVSFGRDEAAANRFAKEVNDDIRRGRFRMGSARARTSLRKYAEDILQLQGGRKSKTMVSYRSTAANHIYPAAIAKLALNTITPYHVEAFLSGLKDLSFGSAKLVWSVLNLVLQKAVEEDLIPKNPASMMMRAIPKTADERLAEMEDVRVLTTEQTETLIEGIRDLRGFLKYALFLCLARTGMRISEGLALMWDAVEFDKHRISVKRNISDGALDSPKQHCKRYIPMTPQLEAVLLKLYKQSSGRLDAFVFPNKRGGFFDDHELRLRTWSPVADEMGIGRITPHILRHTFASTLLANGKSIVYVSKLLGHFSVEMTLKKYAHLIPGDTRNTIDVLDVPVPLALVVGTDPQPIRNQDVFVESSETNN